MKTKSFLLFSGLFLSGLGLWAQEKVAPAANTYESVRIQLNESYGEVEILTLLYNKHPEWKKEGHNLLLIQKNESPAATHWQFQHTYLGVSVLNSGVKVNVTKKGLVQSFMNHIQNWESVASEGFLVNAETLLSTGERQGAEDIKIEAIYLVQGSELVPAYRITAHKPQETAAPEWLLDARTGKLIEKSDRSAYHGSRNHDDSPQKTSVTGQGKVFAPCPITRAQTTYGTLFTDNNDADAPIFSTLMDQVTLQDITLNAGVYSLQGPYVRIEEISPNTFAPATSTTGNFFFTRDESGFEDVMTYYHIDRFQRYVQQLGYNNLCNFPQRADPHGVGNQDNSKFVPVSPTTSYLAFGEGGVDDAEDMDVILHEYGHALSFCALGANNNNGTERRGLDEGTGDYIAASQSQEYNPYMWSDIYTWDGHNQFWAGRTSASANTYPPSTNNIYSYGELWASTLMQIRNTIGGQNMDKIFLSELFYNANNMTLSDGANNLLDADQALFGGANAQVILTYCCQRGFLSGTDCLSVETQNPSTKELHIYPNPSTGSFVIYAPKATEISLLNAEGKILVTQSLREGDNRLEINLSTGIYFIRTAEGFSDKIIVY